jgi:REP element-mobilizing transposase RayT
MPRRLRYIPPGGSLVEVTTRTIQGRFLLRPCRELNQIVVGILARAARLHDVKVMGAVYLSNHFHLLVWVEDAQQLARFMNYHNGNLAREAGRLHGWREKFWSRRYHAVLVSDEEEAQVARLKYLLSHGAKEGLVRSPLDWPGVHCATALLSGVPLEGRWGSANTTVLDGTRNIPDTKGSEIETLSLSPLPCWESLKEESLRSKLAGLLEQVELEAESTRPPGRGSLPCRRRCRRRILRQDPQSRPRSLARRPAPLVHAVRKKIREGLARGYRWFVAAYRQAARRLREGDRSVSFPIGSFPPPLPFVAPAAVAAARPP